MFYIIHNFFKWDTAMMPQATYMKDEKYIYFTQSENPLIWAVKVVPLFRT
jgi:hypothetical protein